MSCKLLKQKKCCSVLFYSSYIDVLHTISSASLSDSRKYFVNCLWAFVFFPTSRSSAAEFTAKKKLEWR